jgi:hypothetical protein
VQFKCSTLLGAMIMVRPMIAAMTAAPGTMTAFHIAAAIHVSCVIATFGVIFARPLVFAAAMKQDRRSLPVLHRIEYTIERVLVVPGMLLVLLSGAYLANWDTRRWHYFYVWWGIGVVLLIGAALATVMIPTARRAEVVVRRDLQQASAEGARAEVAGGGDATRGAGSIALSGEYLALNRRLATVSAVLCPFVLATMLFMGLERPL